MSIEVKPTRSELIGLKRRIKLAKSGHALLKKKRDGLIIEFFKILKEAKGIRKELVTHYKEALYNMKIARATEGDIAVKSIALAIRKEPKVKLVTRNIMGVRVPEIESEKIEKKFDERGYGTLMVSSKINEAASAYEKTLEVIIKVAEIETKMKRMLQEIEKTKRRANALEFAVIPKLEELKRFITLRLEEIERENVFRLKRMKA